jgi:tetratricopeptide (TPR) repeat protein
MGASRTKRRTGKPRAGGAPHTATQSIVRQSGGSSVGIIAAVCVFLVVIIGAAFGQALTNDFVNYDDGEYVYENPHVTGGLTLRGIGWAFTHVHAANWHPLTTISHMVDCQIFGLDPWGHHLTNVLLQAVAAILLFFALRRLTGVLWPCAFAAAIFAIHPLRVESVAWVSERKDLLSGIFFMLTLWAYARYAEGGRYSSRRYIAVIVFFALGLMCKPTLITLPFVLLLLDYWPLARPNKADGAVNARREWRALVIEKIPLFALSAVSAVVTILAQRQALETHLNLTFPERVSNALFSCVAYLGQMIYPARLSVLYPHPEGSLTITVVSLSFLFLLAVSAIFFAWRRQYPFLLVGWLWYLGMLVPMLGLVQVGSQARADRYTYLSQIGLYILVAWGGLALLERRAHGRAILATVAVLVVAVLATDTYAVTAHWQNSETLWRNAIANTPNNYIAYYNLGSVLLRKRQPEAAMVDFRKALELKPDYEEAYASAGSASMLTGQFDGAIDYYKKALQVMPASAEDWSNLASALLQEGQVDEAIDDYQKAVAFKPDSADMHYNLGRALAKKGDWSGAIAGYQAALRIKPDYARVRNSLGAALASAGKSEEAIDQLRQALQINPNYAEAHYNLGCVLAHLGLTAEAISQLGEALRLKPDYVDAENQLRNLGALPR